MVWTQIDRFKVSLLSGQLLLNRHLNKVIIIISIIIDAFSMSMKTKLNENTLLCVDIALVWTEDLNASKGMRFQTKTH